MEDEVGRGGGNAGEALEALPLVVANGEDGEGLLGPGTVREVEVEVDVVGILFPASSSMRRVGCVAPRGAVPGTDLGDDGEARGEEAPDSTPRGLRSVSSQEEGNEREVDDAVTS